MATPTLPRHYDHDQMPDRERLRFLADLYAGLGDVGYDDPDRPDPDTSWLVPED